MSSPGITKQAVAAAMKELMSERPFSKITVSDIAGRSRLNRNSFYYHFKDKFDLVNWIFYTELLQTLNRQERAALSGWGLIECLCGFLYRDRDFYINALSVSGQNSFREYYQEVICGLIHARVPGELAPDEAAFFVTFYGDLIVVTTLRWLREGAALAPEVFSARIRRVLSAGL